MDTQVVEEVPCTTPEELIQRLSPSHPVWDGRASAWIFRGHSKSAYKLLATAHRKGAFDELCVPAELLNLTQAWDRCQKCESWLMKKFQRFLDDAGLPIPQPAPRLEWEARESYGGELPHDGWPPLALAKHYGLPTTLLDWTRRPRCAAYFAAVEAATDKDHNGTLDVWALHAAFVSDAKPDTKRGVLQVYAAPQASNPNLRAQSGLFTMLRGSVEEEVPTVDGFLENYASERNVPGREEPAVPNPLMFRFSLPRSCAPRLLRLLADEGVSGAAMFPGYDGVVKSLREHALWDSARTSLG